MMRCRSRVGTGYAGDVLKIVSNGKVYEYALCVIKHYVDNEFLERKFCRHMYYLLKKC